MIKWRKATSRIKPSQMFPKEPLILRNSLKPIPIKSKFSQSHKQVPEDRNLYKQVLFDHNFFVSNQNQFKSIPNKSKPTQINSKQIQINSNRFQTNPNQILIVLNQIQICPKTWNNQNNPSCIDFMTSQKNLNIDAYIYTHDTINT
jgi:CRISPR/Cas system-associated endonuclease/helicase Cas3